MEKALLEWRHYYIVKIVISSIISDNEIIGIFQKEMQMVVLNEKNEDGNRLFNTWILIKLL